MSSIAWLKRTSKFQSTDDSSTPFLSIFVLSPITSMNFTPSAPSTAWIIPNELPSPIPKMTSAPSAMTCSVTRLPPAVSA